MKLLEKVNIKKIFSKKRLDVLGPSDYKPIFKVAGKPTIPALPDIEDNRTLNVRYPLIPPYAYVHIYWQSSQKELVYEIEEPILTEEENKILSFIEEGIRELVNISFIGVRSKDDIIIYLEKNISILLGELGVEIAKDSFLNIMYYVYRDFVGLNEIEPFMSDYFVEDVECNGINTPIYIVHRKYRNLKTNIVYTDAKRLTNLVEKLAQKCGKYISYASPLLDGSLPDGSRVSATFSADVASRGPSFTIRRFTKDPWTPVQLMELHTLSAEMLAYLWILIEYERNIMVIGGTSSGKTTLLNALAFFIPPQARIVSIEDTRELNLKHENWLPSVARSGIGSEAPSGKQHGEVTLFDLLKESFRQNPDYVIVGEVRGQEAFVLFQGAAAGHPSFSTMHANSVETMIRRLETPPIELSPSLVNSLDVVCVMAQAKIYGQEVRRVREIVEIIDVKEGVGNIEYNVPFKWNPTDDKFYFSKKSHAFKKIHLYHGVQLEKLHKEFEIRTKLLIKLFENKIVSFDDVHRVIISYYKDPVRTKKLYNL